MCDIFLKILYSKGNKYIKYEKRTIRGEKNMIEGNIPKGPPKNIEVSIGKYRLVSNLKMLSGLFLSMLLILSMVTTVVLADSGGQTTGDTVSASAQASAMGGETHTSTEVVISGNTASASATSKARAENGGTATAEVTAQVNWLDTASTYAHAIATTVAGAGETVWAEATAIVSVSISSDTTTAGAQASATGSKSASTTTKTVIGTGIGNGGSGSGNGNSGSGNGENGGNGDPGNDNKDGSRSGINTIIVPPPKEDRSFFGFVFGKSDVERYYYFKHQLTNDNKLSLADNDINVTARAKYYMNIIASDSGLNESQFESKFGEPNTTVSEITDYYVR